MLHLPAKHGGQHLAPEAQPEHGNIVLDSSPDQTQFIHHSWFVRVVRPEGGAERSHERVVRRVGNRLSLVGMVHLVRYATLLQPLHEQPRRRHLLVLADQDGLHPLPTETILSASSSGTASATCNVFAEVSGCSPGPDRSTSHSSTVFVRRPMPISTSTVSPGSIGLEFAGVPVRTTSPGSSVIRRHRSAS